MNPRPAYVPLAASCLVVLSAALAACGSATSGDTSSSGGSSGGTGGKGGTGGTGGTGGASAVTVTLPQFVRGAARADTAAFAQVPLVVGVSGGAPDEVVVTVDGNAVTAAKDGDRFVATIDAASLPAGPHTVVAEAKSGGATVGSAQGSLAVDSGSLQLTKFAEKGPAYSSHLVHDIAGDSLALSWIGAPDKHRFFLSRLDGAFARIAPDDVVLNDPNDEPLSGTTAFGQGSIGVVYRTPKPGDVHWLVKMRVVDPDGNELVPAMDLTQGQAAFSMAQAGVDPGGYSAAWLHIQPPADPNNPPPVEIRYARWDMAAGKLVGPITLDMDQPPPANSGQGTQILEPLAEIGIACNDHLCLVTYSREVYNALVDLNVPKLFLAVVDLATGQLAGPPQPVAGKSWDTQMFGHHLIALDDGSVTLIYTANDTIAAVTPKTPCDETLERDLLFAVRIGADGVVQGKPAPVFDFEGTRQYPRIAAHPAGFSMFWEDQRSECQQNGHIRMSANIVAPDLKSLVDAYLEWPGSTGLPPEDPTLAIASTNFVTAWSDNRHGDGLIDPKPEIYLDTYWRK